MLKEIHRLSTFLPEANVENPDHIPDASKMVDMVEGNIYELPNVHPRNGMKPNRLRQSQNLSILTGFWHGTYYRNGIAYPSLAKSDRIRTSRKK